MTTCHKFLFFNNIPYSIIFHIQEKIVKKLASSDPKEQKYGEMLADEILEKNIQKEIYEDGEIKIKTNRSIINKHSSKEDNSSNDSNKMSRGKFKYYSTIIKQMQF